MLGGCGVPAPQDQQPKTASLPLRRLRFEYKQMCGNPERFIITGKIITKHFVIHSKSIDKLLPNENCPFNIRNHTIAKKKKKKLLL